VLASILTKVETNKVPFRAYACDPRKRGIGKVNSAELSAPSGLSAIPRGFGPVGIELTMAFVTKLTTFRELSHCEDTNSFKPSLVMTDSNGQENPQMLLITLPEAVAMTLILPLTWLET
jgi:hypothetical protein